MRGYVFKAGAQLAITEVVEGNNLPAPKTGRWTFEKIVEDVNAPGLIGFDPAAFERDGFQIWPSDG